MSNKETGMESKGLTPINVLHLIGSSFFGGPEKQILEHLKILDKERFRGVVASFKEPNTTFNEFLGKASDYSINNYSIEVQGPLDFSPVEKIRDILVRESIDLLCVHGYKSVVLGNIAAKKLNIPVLAFSRGYTTENLKVAFYEWLERRFLLKSSGIVSVSNGQKSKLLSLGVNPKNHWVVLNGVHVEKSSILTEKSEARKKLSEQFDIPKNNHLIITAGRLSPEKGHRFLLDAIAELVKSIDNISLIICGDGQCKQELKTQVKQLGLESNIIFVGFRRDMEIYYDAMDFFVLPSLTEGLPNVILESFARSKAVISTNVGGVAELVQHKKNGLLVESQSISQMVNAIKALLLDSELVTQLGKSGLDTVKHKFSFERQTDSLQAIYSKLALDKSEF